MLKSEIVDFVQPYLPQHSINERDFAHLWRIVVKKEIDRVPLSTALIKLRGLSITSLLPIIQEYSNKSGKFFSGYYDRRGTVHIANCPYTGLGAARDQLKDTAFNKSDLNAIAKLVKEKTGRNIFIEEEISDAVDRYSEYRHPKHRHSEYRIVIGLQEGIHGEGKIHPFEKLALERLSKIKPIDAKTVEVFVIKPKQEMYREPAIHVSVWGENRYLAEENMLEVLNVAQTWNHHVIVEDLFIKPTATSYELRGPIMHLTCSVSPGAQLTHISNRDYFANFHRHP